MDSWCIDLKPRLGGCLGLALRGAGPCPLNSVAPISLQVQNLGCYAVRNLSVTMYLPAMAFRRSYFLSITRIIADNVSPWPARQRQEQSSPPWASPQPFPMY